MGGGEGEVWIGCAGGFFRTGCLSVLREGSGRGEDGASAGEGGGKVGPQRRTGTNAPVAGSVDGFHVWKTGRVSAAWRCESILFIQTVTEAAPAAPGLVWMLRGDQSGGVAMGERVSANVSTPKHTRAGGGGRFAVAAELAPRLRFRSTGRLGRVRIEGEWECEFTEAGAPAFTAGMSLWSV